MLLLWHRPRKCVFTQGDVDDTLKEEVQGRVAELDLLDGIIVAFPSVFFCLFVGPWSDTHGRKLLLVAPLFGSIVSYAAYMLNYCFFYQLGTYHLLWGSVWGLFGGYQCLNMGLYGYVSDITSPRDRTARMSVLNGSFSLAYVIGTQIGSLLFVFVGDYYVIFGLSSLIAAVAIAFAVFVLRESVERKSEQELKAHRLLDFENVRDCFRTAFKPRPERVNILILVVNFAVFMFCMNTSHYDYLLVQLQFDWTILQFSNYLTVQRVCRMLGLFLLLPVLSRFLGVRDSAVATVGTALTFAAYLIIAVADVGWLMYVSAALQLNSVITVTIRSQCTKSVDDDETGKIFAVVAFGQAVVPLVANPAFGLIYQATLTTFPGAYLLVVDGLLVFAFVSSVYLWWDETRRTQFSLDERRGVAAAVASGDEEIKA